MKKASGSKNTPLSKLTYLAVTFVFFLSVNFYFSNLIVKKLLNGLEYSNRFVNLIYVQNTGAAFSIMQNSTTVLVVFSLVAIFFALYYTVKNLDILQMKSLFCLSILLAGISGNLYERIHYGYVRDFFELAFVNFPIFNISDILINVGVFAIIVLILLTKKPIKLL